MLRVLKENRVSHGSNPAASITPPQGEQYSGGVAQSVEQWSKKSLTQYLPKALLMADESSNFTTLTLDKWKHKFVLRYRTGEEREALDAIVAWVENPKVPFDWFDSAILAKQVGMRLAKTSDYLNDSSHNSESND